MDWIGTTMKKTAGILIYREKKSSLQVLLVHNGKTWSIPKGRLMRAESVRKAARRELREETCLKAPAVLVELGFVDKRARKRKRLYCFLAEHNTRRKPRPANEIVRTRFMSLSDAMKVVQGYQAPLLTFLSAFEQMMTNPSVPNAARRRSAS
jgi:8-oxo-dGTP diphosphatase